MRRHDFLLAEELKEQFTTMNDENIVVQTHSFHVRAAGEDTRKYQFKIYDEGMLAPLVSKCSLSGCPCTDPLQGYFRPAIFDNSNKLNGRRKLIPRSLDLYDGRPNDPMSEAQLAVISYVEKNIPSAVMAEPAKSARYVPTPMAPTPLKQRPLGIPARLNGDLENTPRSSVAGSPPPEVGTPMAAGDMTIGDITVNDIAESQHDTEGIDRTVPVMPLEQAILTSINLASGTDERRRRDFLGSIMLIGGASKTPDLGAYLEMRLRAAMPQYPKEILVVPPPRELDPAVLVWKGGSVFGKLRTTNDSWISPLEHDRLGARILNYKCMWHW
jgi:actin-related protein 8